MVRPFCEICGVSKGRQALAYHYYMAHLLSRSEIASRMGYALNSVSPIISRQAALNKVRREEAKQRSS